MKTLFYLLVLIMLGNGAIWVGYNISSILGLILLAVVTICVFGVFMDWCNHKPQR